ncbi:MAG: prepilin-type N-terminal cleavage/methylation domain-containing protein [Gammaproteobacteria bacterium]|nr:prepilin-type N-terminal cleavage/methylation domain-containing protein [Gammaproteobacteria bacterium]
MTTIDKQNGLTLLELMVVVAVIAILSVIGWSQYRAQFHEGTRGDAVAALTTSAAHLQTCYSRTIPNSYTNCEIFNMGTGKCSNEALAANNDTNIYSRKCSWIITFSSLSSSGYQLTATRTYIDDDSTQKEDIMTLNHLGQRGGNVDWPR